ncbi:MAG: nucleotidyltransferase family protein [Acidobacteria bacterium]|nr:nucleotidyltransferase family protein [Acidobacteriota bacterium]
MVTAIVLAAGESKRMGRPKALLPDREGRPFVARLVRAFAAAGVDDVILVTGTQHAAIAAAVAADAPLVSPTILINPDPARGQLSSLWIGLEAAARPGLEAVLVTPVDIPMVRPSTIQQVVEVWRTTRAPIVRPAVGARHGHPVLFDRAVFDELRRAPLADGARAVVHAHADSLVNVPVDDEGCLVDVDTPADYDALIRRSSGA